MKDKKVREELIIDAFAMLFLLAGELYFSGILLVQVSL